MNNFKHFVSLCLILILNCQPAYGWGKTGHRIVGGVADLELSDKARKFVSHILDGQTLAMVSNEADLIRSNKVYQKYNSYHYINEHLVSESHDIQKDDNHALNGISEFVLILKSDKKSKAEKRFALAFLTHLVGDIHQPLHVGYKKDKGGNLVIVDWFGVKVNLHKVWDELLINMQELSYSEYILFLYKTPSLTNKKVKLKTPKDWALESKEYLAQTYKYKVAPYWEYKYNYEHIHKLNERLFVAGKRLAGILNNGL
jgi:hypothetical protein